MADPRKIGSALTQAQADAEALYAKAASIDPYQAALIKKNAQGNIMSPGVLTALSNLGVDTASPVANSLANIDAATRETRLADQKKIAADREKENFNNTLRGKFWTTLKGAVRGTVTAFSAFPELIDATYRAGGMSPTQAVKDLFNPTAQAKRLESQPNPIEQSVAGQVILESWKNVKKGKPFYADINMGSGFLPNEETGVAHAARQASLSAAKVAIRDDNGKVVGYRAATFFGDKAANVFTLGNPETQSGAVIAAVADIVGSFAVDPGIARAQNIKNLRKLAAQQRAANAVQAAAKTEERIAELTKLQDEALAAADAVKSGAANLKNVEAEAAKAALGVGLSKAEREAQATQRIKSAQSVRIAQARLDEFASIEAKEAEALAAAREARLAAEAAFKAPKQVERAEKALAKQRKQLEEMTAAREDALSRGLVPAVPEEDIAALADSIRIAEQNIADTRNLITTKASGEELVKEANPNLYNTNKVELVDVNFLKKFIEFDRTLPALNKGDSAGTIASITEDLKAGKGFTDPLILDYWVDANGKLMLNLTEGNHRIQAAINAGIDYIPVRVLRGYESRLDQAKASGLASKILPDSSGYLPGTLRPSEILPEDVIKQAQAMAKDAITPEALAAAKELEAKALRRLREVKSERQFAERQVAERARTQALVEKATQQASRETLKAVKKNATLADKLNDATLSVKDRQKAWELAVLRLSNADQTLERPEFAYQKIAEFLTNGHGTAAVDRLVKMTDWKEIWRKSGQRLTAEQARAIADATTPDEVVDALAPFLKRGEIKAGVVEPGLLARGADTAAGRLSKLGQALDARTNYIVPEARKLFGAGAKVAQRISHHEKVAALSGAVVKASKAVTRSYTTKVKGGSIINIHDREALLVAVEDFGKAAKLPQNVLDDLLEKIAVAESNSVAGYTASAKLLDAVFSNAAEKIPAHLKKSFEDYTTAFKDSNEEMASYWANRHATGAHIKFLTQNGKSVVLPGPHLDSELLNSTIYLPPVSELLKMTSRVAKYSSITKGREVADKVIGDWWKKTVLVRPAYIIRNIAEEQIRVAAVGHASFFTRPGLALAMWLGKEDGPYVRRLLKQFDTYDNTVFGNSFTTGDEALDVLDETLAHGLKNSFVDMMNSGKTGADERDFRALVFRNVSDVPFGHKRFFDGVTNQLRMLNSSEFGRVVAGYDPKFVKDAMAKGQFRQEAVVDYFLTGPGRRTLNAFAEGTPSDFSAFIKTPEGLKAYLFTGKSDKGIDVSVLARISETTGGNKVLQNLVAYGKVKVGGKELAIPRPDRDAMNSIQNSKAMREGKKALLEEQDLLAKDIKALFADSGNWENVRVNVPSKNVAYAEGEKDKVGLVNRFFEISTTLEKNTTFGPEFRQAYWDAINEIALTLDSNAKAQLLEVAEGSLTPLQKAGVNVGSKHPVWNAFKSSKGDGPMTLEDAHIYADTVAREHVKELFYNAQEKRLIFHQLRLIAPFANAWENTITKWVELGTENKLAVYKAVKVLDWLNSPESSALYQMTDAKDYYDPNQGFFFTDPNSGQRQFFVPFAGTVMASLAKGITGVDYKGAPIAFSANPMSFNFAFGQGTMLPGVGPGVTLPLSVLGTFNGNYIDAMPVGVQKWLFPYGRANFSGGLQTAVLPGNWNRILGGLFGMEQTYASNFKPVMNYLASGANYNLDNPDDQAQLVKDTDTFARWESVMRGIVGLVSPMALIQQGLGKDKDGDLTLQTTLYNDFQELYQKNDGDYNKAWFDFLNLYGAPQAFALISSSAGEAPSNWDSYNFVVDNPDVATKYKDIWGYVMPGGGLSTEMYNWNIAHDTKVKLSPTQILQKVNNQRFYAAKDALLTQVDAGMMDKNDFSEALKTLKDAMGGGPVYEFDLTKKTRRISQLNRLIEDERFVDIPSVVALRNYMAIRQHILTTIGKTDFTGAQNEQPARDYLAAQAEWIIKDYPDFQKMFYGFFANELEGR